LSDVKTTGTQGGTFSSGNWVTRTLNTTNPTQTWVSLSSNRFTLSSGGYYIFASAPASDVGSHQTRLLNVNNSNETYYGTSETVKDGICTRSFVMIFINISSSTTYSLQHRCSKTSSSSGLGIAAGFSGNSEVYSIVTIFKLS
jgi:hypothetical protein